MRLGSLFAFGLFAFTLFLPSSVFAERIESFETTMEVQEEGTVKVVEKIQYNFEGERRHGIFRTIPAVKTNAKGKKFEISFSDIGVTNGNLRANYPFTTSQANRELTIKIGDANRTVTGVHTYIISYTVSGALTHFSDHDELYWNVTGNGWKVPIQKASAVVSLPSVVAEGKTRQTCYTGQSGGTFLSCKSEFSGRDFLFEMTSGLGPGEGLTIVAGFPVGIVSIHEPKEIISFFDTVHGKIIGLVLLFGGGILFIFWYIFYPLRIFYLWYLYGRDPKTSLGTASAWFDPPKNEYGRLLTPAETGMLIDESVDLKDIYATIIDLARRGFIRIVEEKDKTFSFEKRKLTTDKGDVLPFEKQLLTGIFGSRLTVTQRSLRLWDTIAAVQKNVYEHMVSQGFFPENPQTLRTRYTVMTVLAFITANVPLFLSAFLFGRNMPRRTEAGAAANMQARALRNFLGSQERQLNFQAQNQMYFEKLLPYAVAFGVEKVWAERFKDIAMKEPDWYSGQDPSHFSSVHLGSRLSSGFSRINASSSSSSSYSGFSSGFSGGSSGGGGGGGGGGSW